LPRFSVHPRLLEDCHALGRFALSRVLLHRNASLPWFILVPEIEAEVIELHELDPARRRMLDDETDTLARFVKAEFDVRKLNIASIGNVVPQLHVHIIGRHPEDPCWPGVAWGNLPAGPTWPPERVAAISAMLAAIRPRAPVTC
jgi:diadenosine tetraphosphate (Ap4A) HIT family hydrolase